VKIITVTAPTDTPVSVAEAREQCALLDDASHDDLLARLIAAATASVEIDTGARLMPQTLRIEYDGFPDDALDLGIYPIQSVTSVKYDDTSEAEQTLATSGYWEDLSGRYPRLVPNEIWPAVQALKPSSVRVVVVAGYADAASVPGDLRHAILLRVSELFNNRDESVVGLSVAPTVNTIKALISPHRRYIF
jgi:uncharacterized phiE125 gp8 family phage protein